MTKDEILKALSFVLEPDLKKDVVSLNLVSNIGIDGDKVTFDLKVQNNALHNKKRIEEACIFHIQNKVLRAAQVQVSIDALPKEDEAAVQKDPMMEMFIEDYKEKNSKQSKAQRAKIKKEQEKSGELLNDFGIGDGDIDNIFDIISYKYKSYKTKY